MNSNISEALSLNHNENISTGVLIQNGSNTTNPHRNDTISHIPITPEDFFNRPNSMGTISNHSLIVPENINSIAPIGPGEFSGRLAIQ